MASSPNSSNLRMRVFWLQHIMISSKMYVSVAPDASRSLLTLRLIFASIHDNVVVSRVFKSSPTVTSRPVWCGRNRSPWRSRARMQLPRISAAMRCNRRFVFNEKQTKSINIVFGICQLHLPRSWIGERLRCSILQESVPTARLEDPAAPGPFLSPPLIQGSPLTLCSR